MNPLKEAERFVARVQAEEKKSPGDSALLIAGVAWGYHVPLLIAAFPERELYFYEPVSEILTLLADRRRPELEEMGARLISEKEARALTRSPGGARSYVWPAHQRLFPDLLSAGDARRPGATPEAATAVDAATRARFFRQWAWNFFKLLGSETELRMLRAAKRSPETIFLYCGAGPELSREIAPLSESLRDPNRNVFLIAADTALGPLLAQGIEPDLALSLDSGRGTAYHFAAAARLGAPGGRRRFPFPALSWTVGPSFLSDFFEHRFYYRSTFPFDQALGEGPFGACPEWSNASRNMQGIALLFASASGASALYTAGATLTAVGDRSHERGTGYEFYARTLQNRLRPLESYRPGGYAENLTVKNEAARRGMESMALENGIEIRPLGNNPPPASAPRKSRKTRLEEKFEYETYDAEELRAFLKKVWDRIDFAALLDGGIPPEEPRKWRRLLTPPSG